MTLVVLVFASRFGAQLVTALVAGDIVANEDSTGTLKMVFTRSAKRAQLLATKTLASFTYVLTLLIAIVTRDRHHRIVARCRPLRVAAAIVAGDPRRPRARLAHSGDSRRPE